MRPILRKFRRTLEGVNSDLMDTGLFYRHLQLTQRNRDGCDWMWAQMPESKEHFHVLNPAFSFEPVDENAVNIYPFWLVRDGFFPLVKFFVRRPSYPGYLLVHEDFSFLVPPGSRHGTFLYGLRPRKRRSGKRRDKVIVVGILNGASFSPSYFKRRVAQIDRLLKRHRMDWGSVHVCFFLRDNRFFSVDERQVNPIVAYMGELETASEGKFRLIGERDFFRIPDFSSWLYVCLHENRILVADNYMEHYFLAKGGLPLFGTAKKSIDGQAFMVPASPYHDYALKPFHYSKGECRFPEVEEAWKGFAGEEGYGNFFFFARRFLASL